MTKDGEAERLGPAVIKARLVLQQLGEPGEPGVEVAASQEGDRGQVVGAERLGFERRGGGERGRDGPYVFGVARPRAARATP